MKRSTVQAILPIGTIVTLKGGDKKIMIVGRIQEDVKGKKRYDYSSVYYPEGYVDPQVLFLFNQEDIDKIYYVGMQDSDEFAFRDYMEQKLTELGLLEEV